MGGVWHVSDVCLYSWGAYIREDLVRTEMGAYIHGGPIIQYVILVQAQCNSGLGDTQSPFCHDVLWGDLGA